MELKIPPKIGVLSVKYWVQIIVCWPPPLNATMERLIFHNIMWLIAIMNPLHLIPALMYDAFTGTFDLAKVIRHIAEVMTLVATISKMCVCQYYKPQLQVLCADLETFIETAKDRERTTLDRYSENFGKFHLCLQVVSLMAAISFCFGPMILDQPLPGQTEYPFPWRHSPTLTAILFFTHVAAIFQVTAMGILDMLLAWLVWFIAMRFELLAEDFEKARTSTELRECIKKHQQLLTYVEDIITISQAFIVPMIINTGITNVCAGYQFVSHQRWEIVVQYFLLIFVSSLEVMVCSWPADHLIATSIHIRDAAFYAPWIDKTELAKDIEIVMQRANKPVVVAVKGFLSQINLEFYGKYLTTVFSYFTTLRAFVD